MERKEFILQEDDSGRRLDRVLKRLLPNRTAAQIYSSLRKGLVKINGRKVSENYITQKGDTLSVASFLLDGEAPLAPSTASQLLCKELYPLAALAACGSTSPFSLQKIFVNENFLLINKPSGISVHGKGSLSEIVAAQSKNESLSFRAGPLHRLDKETTGLLAFSQSLAGAKWFSANIKNHAIKKYYLGIVCGCLESAQTWNDLIDGKDAITIATPLAWGSLDYPALRSSVARRRSSKEILKPQISPISFVEFQILTGRKHQIRIHSAAHGFPLLGDAKHGRRLEVGNAKRGAFFLHAYKMEFPQNALGLPPVLQAPLPLEFAEFLHEYFPLTQGQVADNI